MGPQQDNLYRDVGAGIKYPLRTENSLHDRNDHVCRIGIHDGCTFHNGELFADGADQCQKNQLAVDGGAECKEQTLCRFGSGFNLKCVDNNAGSYKINSDGG